jgi:hypothetical protein
MNTSNQRKANGMQSNQLAEISDYVGNRREMKDSKTVPVGLPVGQNEPTPSEDCRAGFSIWPCRSMHIALIRAPTLPSPHPY